MKKAPLQAPWSSMRPSSGPGHSEDEAGVEPEEALDVPSLLEDPASLDLALPAPLLFGWPWLALAPL
jgi:hypothetical protein